MNDLRHRAMLLRRCFLTTVACLCIAATPRALAQPQSPNFTSGSPPPGAWHVPYTFTLTASGNPAPIFLAVPSQMFLPPGLVLNGTTGVLSGTPTQAGTFGFLVQASNGLGTAPYQSMSVFFAPNQTITFDPLPDRIAGSPPFRLSATASSGLTVGFGSSTPTVCTASFGMATLVAAGTCTINAIQGGNASFSNALPVARSFIVTAAGTQSQTIAFAVLANRAYGSGALTLSASATSGLPVTFSSLTSSVCSVDASSVALLSQGTCTIRASQAGDATFAGAPNVDRSFLVTAPLINQTITFATLPNKSLDVPPFSIGATASSGLPVAFSSLTVAVCTVAGSTVTLVATGACTIRASQPGNAAYAPAADVDRTFTVAAAIAQTISFSTLADRPFKSQPFTLSATTSSGLTVSFSTMTSSVCTVTASTVTVLAVGTCTIRAGQPGNSSYAAAPNVDRSFNVVRAAQAIAFLPITLRALGNPPFEMLATSSSGLVVTFASLTPSICRVNDQWLSFIAIGVCTVRAMQAGSGNSLAAASVEQSFPITAANQTLLFPQPQTQSTLHPFTPSATASSGLPVTFDSLTPAICTCNGTTVTLIAAGTCTIRATQAGNANYTAISVDRSFQVQANAGIARAETPPGPMIAYSTLLGGFRSSASAASTVFDIAVLPDGAAIVGGSVAGSYFPGLDAATFTNGGLDLLFVARMKPDRGAVDMATVVGARSPDMTGTGSQTYIGAFDTDMAEAIAVDGAGTTYVAAYANGRTYPLTGSTYLRAGQKAIFRVDGAGNVAQLPALIDPAVRSIRALALDALGGIYFTGVAVAGLGTTAGAAIPASSAPAGGPYLIKLAPGGTSVAYATYLSVSGSRSSSAPSAGQASIDSLTTGYALAVDASGSAYVAGQAKAGDFPVTPGSPDTQDNQNRDAFVAKINPAGSALTWVARLGGNDAERATSVALAPDGGVVIGGKTATRPFLGTNNAFQYIVPFQSLDLYCLCTESGFVAKLAVDGSRWIFVAALGAYGGTLVRNFTDTSNSPVKVAVDAAGAIYATGYTSVDRQLPLGSRPPLGNLMAIQSPGFYDDGTAVATYGSSAALRGVGGFLMKMSDDGHELFYSVIVNSGPVVALKVDAFGAAYIAGVKAGRPQIAAAQAAPGAVFVAKVLAQSAPIVLAASPSPSIAGATVVLTATLADARYSGNVEFRDGGQLVGTAPVVNGSASLGLTPIAGVHRFIATFLGDGPFNGAQSIDVVHAVSQAGPTP